MYSERTDLVCGKAKFRVYNDTPRQYETMSSEHRIMSRIARSGIVRVA